MKGAHWLFSDSLWNRIASELKMSPRQLLIVRGILEEKKACAIALELGLKPRTVETHIERVFKKAGVRSRLGLAVVIFGIIIRENASMELYN
jgi:DNA-binding NarL/FixJ family response regulator